MDAFLSKDEIVYLNHLIAELYNGKNMEDTFTSFLRGVGQIVPFEKGEIYFYKYEKGNVVFEDFITLEWSLSEFEKYHKDQNIKMDDNLSVIARGNPLVYRYSDIFNLSELKKSEYYREVICPLGFQNSAEGNILIGEDGHIGGIGIHRSKGHDFSNQALEIIKFARPHLMNIARKFKSADNDLIGGYQDILSLVGAVGDVGMCIWDEDLNLCFSNVKGIFSFSDKAQEEMLSLLTDVIASKINLLATGLKFPVEFSLHRQCYFANLSALPAHQKSQGRYVAILYNFSLIFSDFLLSIKNSYGLSAREVEVLNCIIEGYSNQEISEKLFISVSTVKKHLAQTYEKLGIDGKYQLLKLLL